MVSFIWAMRFLFWLRVRGHQRKFHLLAADFLFFSRCHRNEISKNSFESFVLFVTHAQRTHSDFC